MKAEKDDLRIEQFISYWKSMTFKASLIGVSYLVLMTLTLPDEAGQLIEE